MSVYFYVAIPTQAHTTIKPRENYRHKSKNDPSYFNLHTQIQLKLNITRNIRQREYKKIYFST